MKNFIVKSDLTIEEGKKAPELIVGGEWLNSPPLNLSKLKEKVVLIEFMTYTCINCIRVFPFLQGWHEKYSNKGLVVIGIQTPEFGFEKEIKNVKNALKEQGITFPVMQDNNHETWDNYNNNVWPRKIIIDKEGIVRFDHSGEGAYEEAENKIQELLGKKSPLITDKIISKLNYIPSKNQTPELYFGYERGEILNSNYPEGPGTEFFQMPEKIVSDEIVLIGDWEIEKHSIRHLGKTLGSIMLSFSGKEINIVLALGKEKEYEVEAEINGKPIEEKNAGKDITYKNGKSILKVNTGKMYSIAKNLEKKRNLIILKSLSENFEAFAFTFG